MRILEGLVTGHADLNQQHLALINVKSDGLCPLGQEEEEASLRLLRKCIAKVRIHFEVLGTRPYLH